MDPMIPGLRRSSEVNRYLRAIIDEFLPVTIEGITVHSLEHIYVAPRFRVMGRRTIEGSEILSRSRGTLIVGPPGSGKTMFRYRIRW